MYIIGIEIRISFNKFLYIIFKFVPNAKDPKIININAEKKSAKLLKIEFPVNENILNKNTNAVSIRVVIAYFVFILWRIQIIDII